MNWLPRMLNDGTPIPLPELEHANTVRPEPPEQPPIVYAVTAADLAEIPERPAPTDEELDAMAREYETLKYGGMP